MGTQWLSLWAVQCGCVWWGDGEGAWLGLGKGCHQPGLLQLLRRVCGSGLLQDGILTWLGKVSDQDRQGECQEGKWVKIFPLHPTKKL